MHHALLVRRLQALAHLLGDAQADADGERALARDEVLEGDALEVLHRDVGRASRLVEIVGAEHVAMGDTPGQLDLLLEALQQRGIVLQELGAQDLERDLLVELAVAGAVDDAHPAPGDLARHLVAGDGREPGGVGAVGRGGRSVRGRVGGAGRCGCEGVGRVGEGAEDQCGGGGTGIRGTDTARTQVRRPTLARGHRGGGLRAVLRRGGRLGRRGRERTAGEYRELLDRAGWQMGQIVTDPGGMSVIEATRPATNPAAPAGLGFWAATGSAQVSIVTERATKVRNVLAK